MIFNRRQMHKFQIKMLLFTHDPYKRAEFLKKSKVFYAMGNNCFYQPRNLPTEPFLVSMKDNVYICANVRFITHDVLGDMLWHAPQYSKQVSICNSKFFMGRIEIGNNVVIGADSTILYGVKIGDNVVIGAGSIITHDVPSGSVVAGNPAKIIGNYDDLANKRIEKLKLMPKKSDGEEKLLSYFWKNQK